MYYKDPLGFELLVMRRLGRGARTKKEDSSLLTACSGV